MASFQRSAATALSGFERLSLSSTTRRTISTSASTSSASASSSSSSIATPSSSARLSSQARAEISAKTGGHGRVLARRGFSSTPTRDSLLASLRDRLTKTAFGSNYAQARERGGVLPEEARKQELARKRDAAMASVSPDGEALFDESEAESLPALQSQERANQRLSAKIEARQQRKRWNATDEQGRALEHKYSTALFKISPRKLKLLADQIGGKPIDHAILQMQFSPKRASKRILSTLALARDHAAAKGMEVRRLIVSEAWISKGRYLVRADFKGRARMGRKHHPEAKMSIVLRYGKMEMEKELERLDKARKAVRSIGDGSVTRTNRKILNTWQRPGWQW